jgi:hypothetical protein
MSCPLPRIMLASASVFVATVATAQERDKSFLYVNELGDVLQTSTDNSGRLHVTGTVGLETAGYFRGIFDDVPEDLDSLEYGPSLRLTFELPSVGHFRDVSLTFGTGNNFWTKGVIPTDKSDIDDWFESDNFVGLAARLGPNWHGSLTYTAFTSPNGASATAEELAFAARYVGDASDFLMFDPQMKLAVPVDGSDGAFLQLTAAPDLGSFSVGKQDVSVSLPLTVGIGIDDYYGDGTDTTGYFGASLSVSAPLNLPDGYGDWTLGASLDGIYRSDELVAFDPIGEDAGNFVTLATISLSFAF